MKFTGFNLPCMILSTSAVCVSTWTWILECITMRLQAVCMTSCVQTHHPTQIRFAHSQLLTSSVDSNKLAMFINSIVFYLILYQLGFWWVLNYFKYVWKCQYGPKWRTILPKPPWTTIELWSLHAPRNWREDYPDSRSRVQSEVCFSRQWAGLYDEIKRYLTRSEFV